MWCATSQSQHILPASAHSVDGVMVDQLTSVHARPWHLHRRRPQHENSRTANRVVVFHRTPSVATDSPGYTASHVPETGGSFGSVATGLWQRRILVDLPTYLVRRLQSVLNAFARLSATSLRAHHWRACQFTLAARPDIQFKIVVLAYKVLHGTAPRYLGPLVRVSDLPGRRCLRSASTNRLVVPSFKLSTIGSRTFKVAAAQPWNARGRNNVTNVTNG